MAASTDHEHPTGSALPARRTPDLARAVETVVPDAILARTDPALFGRTVLQLAQGWVTHPGAGGSPGIDLRIVADRSPRSRCRINSARRSRIERFHLRRPRNRRDSS